MDELIAKLEEDIDLLVYDNQPTDIEKKIASDLVEVIVYLKKNQLYKIRNKTMIGCDSMAEGGLPDGPMKDKWLKLMHTSRDSDDRDYCMNCHHYKWYKDEECIKLSCHVDMLEEKPCFEKRYVE